MNEPELSVEEASRLAVTATAADLEYWAHSVAVDGQIELRDLLDLLGVVRTASAPQHTTLQANLLTPALSLN